MNTLGKGFLYSLVIHCTVIVAIVSGQIQMPFTRARTVDLTLLGIDDSPPSAAKSSFRLPQKISQPEKPPEEKIVTPPDLDENTFSAPDPNETVAAFDDQTASLDADASETSSGSSGDMTPDYMTPKDYFNVVRYRIESRKSYPESARLEHIEGVIKAKFTINMDGMADSVEIAKSSGCSDLDIAALNAIKNAAPFPALPRNLFKDKLNIELAVIFELK